MNAFELYATLRLNSSAFDSALGKSGKGIDGLARKLTGTLATLKLTEKAFDGIKKVVSGSVEQFGRYQQLQGGVKKIFGEQAAVEVINNANKAFETVGISANNYMEAVTGFSASLKKSLKGDDIKLFATIADMAMKDMADNANTYGTSIEDVQAVYEALAKGNYTTLDNLKLGYAGTQQGMIDLINDSGVLDKKITNLNQVTFADMITALHATQERLHITGTTADEAGRTVEGSANAMKASFQNLLSVISTGDESELKTKMQEFQTSFNTYVGNMIPVAITSLANTGTLFSGLVGALTNIDPNTADEIASALINTITTGGASLAGLGEWIVNGIASLFSSDSQTLDGVQGLAESIGSFIATSIQNITTDAPQVVKGLVQGGMNLGEHVLRGLVNGMFGEGSFDEFLTGLDGIQQSISQWWNGGGEHGEGVKKQFEDSFKFVFGVDFAGASAAITQWIADIQKQLTEWFDNFKESPVGQFMHLSSDFNSTEDDPWVYRDDLGAYYNEKTGETDPYGTKVGERFKSPTTNTGNGNTTNESSDGEKQITYVNNIYLDGTLITRAVSKQLGDTMYQ